MTNFLKRHRRVSSTASFLAAGLLASVGATTAVAAPQSPTEASAIAPTQDNGEAFANDDGANGDDGDSWDEPITDSNGNVVGESRGASQETEGVGSSRTDSVTDYRTGETTVTTTTVDENGDGTRHTTVVDANGNDVPGSDKTEDIKGAGKFGEDDDFS
ncbi:hypothetical protein [Streptomyces griseoluteus]|uniref:hypothetical protein n=1 Tax=Streptomyces griseoluteus TaxID=29306 RepID=UPI003416EEB7